ncbi:4'-phosphopantetheinyl transferase family protein [Methylobacter psychrophilus]|uniref:4'-phosphopantetheinyl transferase family protein n=1 Tax=Methylobacter psychrophilus TaxID=96941 RepID=UPI0021D4AD36|nr:4'-phosphopantetheinyl transferase superfamily protein [Methylobacter psychrophilus]
MRVEQSLGINEVEVWHGTVAAQDPNYLTYWRMLDNAEQNQVQKFKQVLLQQRYVVIHGRLRQLLGQLLNQAPEKISIKKAKYGKPYLADYPELAFNISHTADKVVIALGWNCHLGIDIEICKPRINVSGLVNKCFAKEEIAYWTLLPEAQKTQVFYRFWTRKEAFVKATGQGIISGLHNCVVNPEKPVGFLRVPDLCGKACAWHIVDIELGEGLCSALVTDKKISVIKQMAFTE